MKIVRMLGCLLLLAISLAAFSPAVFAQETPAGGKPVEKLEMQTSYPKLEAIAGGNFAFDAQFLYTGEKARVFDLRATVPKDWQATITPAYETDKKLTAIRLEPGFSFGDKVSISVSSPFYPLPEPGKYPVTFEAVSGNITATLEYTAIITASYTLNLVSPTERYNTFATAGKDNFFSIDVNNYSTAPIENINFSPTKPEGWTIEFVPEKIDTLEALDKKTVDMKIVPPPRTVAGDYMISVSASGRQASAQKIDIRVTVETPTVWGWVGVAIILIAVAGLVVIFMRFSRR